MVHGTALRCGGRTALIAASALVLMLAGCATEDPLVVDSRDKLAAMTASNPDYTTYGAALLAVNPSPDAQALLNGLIVAENLKIARESVNVIVDNPPESTRESLKTVFDTKRGLLKLVAGIAAARLGDEDAMAGVREECLDETGQSLTIPAVKLLAEKGEAEALTPFLRTRMGHDEPSIRNEAYVMLGAIKQEWATKLLMEGLDNEFGAEREQAILSLGQTGYPAAAKKIEKFVNTQGLVFASLEALGQLGNPDSTKVLRRQLDHKSELVRLYAAAAIWRLGDEEAGLEIIGPMAVSEDAAIRMDVARQIMDLDAPAAREILVKMASDEDGTVRLAAVRALAETGDPELVPLFVNALSDVSYQVSTSALDALARIGGAEQMEAIAPFLENQNPYVVMSAANAALAITDRTAGGA